MRNIELLSGPVDARTACCLRRTHDVQGAVWLQRGRPRRPWEGFRQLVFQVRDVLGVESVREVLRRHRPAADLLLVPTSSSRPSELAARLESHLSHNALVKRPFIDECVEILRRLLGSRDVLLVAPDVAELDAETVWLLEKFFQRRPEAFPSAVLGFEPDPNRAAPDERGIVWGPFQTDLLSFMFNLGRLPGAERREAVGGDVPGEKLVAVRERRGSDEDGRLLQAFEAASETPGPELRRAMVGLVRRAFAGHAFEAALQWGLRVLERCPDLEPLDAAELLDVTALSAHNRQFHSTGNETLTPCLEAHWSQARDLETRPGRRSAICYRLAVTLGRRQDRYEEALEMADEAAEVARAEPSDVASTYLEAWARNVRALLWMRLGRLDKAVEDTERALESVDAARNRLPADARGAWERDWVVSGSVLVNNRIALARLEDDPDALEAWERRRGKMTEDLPELELYETAGWLQSYRRALRFDLALDQAERGLELARAERNVLWEYVFLAHVADLAFRLGRVERSIEACEAAHTFRRQFGSPDVLESLDLLHAEALGRAGRGEAARHVVQAVLQEPDLSSARRIEAHALAARLAAEDGDAQSAEDSANAAIEAAVEHGHRDSLLLAAVAAGTASRRLGRADEARSAHARALEIAAAGEPEDPPPPAGDLLEAHLGLWRHDAEDPRHVLQALRTLPAALTEPRGWWLLDSLTAAVEEVRRRKPSSLETPDLATPWEQLRLAGRQRL